MTFHVKDGGTWREIVDGPAVKVSGTWRNIDFGYVKVSNDWKEFYVRDQTGPVAVTSATVTWNNGDAVVAWTNSSDADFDHVVISRIRNPYAGSSAYLDGNVATVSGSSSQAKSWTDTNILDNYMVYRYRITPYDARGNAGTPLNVDSMAWTGTARGRTPSPITIGPTDSGTWRGTGWRSDSYVQSATGTYTQVYQGSTSSGENYGFYFYGTQIYDLLAGTTVSLFQLNLKRDEQTTGYSGGSLSPAINWHSCTARASSCPPSEGFLSGMGWCVNGDCPQERWETLPTSWYDNFFSPSASTRARGVTLQGTSTITAYYSGWKSYDESDSGDLKIYHSG